DLTGRLESDAGGVVGDERPARLGTPLRPTSRRLDVGADAHAEVAAAGAGFNLIDADPVVVKALERLVERLAEASGVVDHAGAGRVGELLRPDHVATAELGRVDPQLASGAVDEKLARAVPRRPADPAVRRDRRLVRQHGDDLVLEVLDPVDARHERCREVRLDERARVIVRVRARVTDDPRPQPEEAAVGGERELRTAYLPLR